MNKNISNKKRSPLKERQLRYPGQSLDKKTDNLLWEIGLLVGLSSVFTILAFFEWWQWYKHLPPQVLTTSIVAVAVVVYSSVKIWRIKKQLPGYRLGKWGEREVGQILNKLTAQRYTILHDVWAGKFNVDHVVISPRGIFAIETKAISKPARGSPEIKFDGEKITLTGHPPDAEPVMEAQRHAAWLRQKLGNKISERKNFPVKPVVVYPGWWRDRKGYNKDIWVLNPEMLEVQISREPQSLTEEDIEMAKERLKDYSTTPADDSAA